MVEVEVALMFPIGFRGTGQSGVDLAAALGWVKIGIDHYCEYITKQRISVLGSLSLRQSNSIQFFRHPKARCHPSRHSLHSTHLSHSPTTISNCAYHIPQTRPAYLKTSPRPSLTTTHNHPPPKNNVLPPLHPPPLPRIPTPLQTLPRRHHRRPHLRRRHLHLGSPNPRPRRHPLRGRCLRRRNEIPPRLPAQPAHHALRRRRVAPQRYFLFLTSFPSQKSMAKS